MSYASPSIILCTAQANAEKFKNLYQGYQPGDHDRSWRQVVGRGFDRNPANFKTWSFFFCSHVNHSLIPYQSTWRGHWSTTPSSSSSDESQSAVTSCSKVSAGSKVSKAWLSVNTWSTRTPTAKTEHSRWKLTNLTIVCFYLDKRPCAEWKLLLAQVHCKGEAAEKKSIHVRPSPKTCIILRGTPQGASTIVSSAQFSDWPICMLRRNRAVAMELSQVRLRKNKMAPNLRSKFAPQRICRIWWSGSFRWIFFFIDQVSAVPSCRSSFVST